MAGESVYKATRQDRIRERELFRFYQPDSSEDQHPTRSTLPKPSDTLVSPDTTLTALGQLVALRLNVSRCTISVIARTTQYTLAESTRTLNLIDTTRSDVGEDALWLGCGSMDKSEGICDTTCKLEIRPGLPACLIIPDLQKDERYSNLSFVAGFPEWRFYSGTPLRTKSGINIGALCILDHTPREGLSDDQQSFMVTVAETIMSHLEMKREAEERRKMSRMTRGLNAFVEGRSFLQSEVNISYTARNGSESRRRTKDANVSPSRTGKAPASLEHAFPLPSNSDATDPGSLVYVESPTAGSENATGDLQLRPSASSSINQSLLGRQSPHDGSELEPQTNDMDRGYDWIYARAANLLRESLDLREDDGVVFLDTSISIGDEKKSPSCSSSGTSSSDSENESHTDHTPHRQPQSKSHLNASSRSYTSRFESELKETETKTARILKLSTAASPISAGPSDAMAGGFNPLGQRFLQDIFKHYPRGKLWIFDSEGSMSSADEKASLLPDRKPRSRGRQFRRRRKEEEARLLQASFPGVRQLLFAPLWDASHARWSSGCFCWTTSQRLTFSTESELGFLIAFGNSIMVEVSRLSTVAADRQKADFIGSVSHELRSPLNGILASAEFLADTSCDPFQTSLIDTIDSCGRTLLDTINHVLDYSKINSFERNWRKAQNSHGTELRTPVTEPGKVVTAQSMPGGAPPLLNIFGVTDVAAICEEVVEGVYAGQIYQDFSSADVTDTTAGVSGRTSNRGLVSAGRSSTGVGDNTTNGEYPVNIVLDILPGDYTFTTQPGALRRVIMNIFGNALKYTAKGMIAVKLELRKSEAFSGDDSVKNLLLTIKDTGKGISSSYLQTRLFTPFAQENSLAPGTGLGLSIVRSIVNMLAGSIDIQSEIGIGTEVRVSLPLKRPPSQTRTLQTTPSTAGSIERVQDDSIGCLRTQLTSEIVAVFGMDQAHTTELSALETGKALKRYISDWYGGTAVSTWTATSIPEVIIVDEKDVVLLESQPTEKSSILIICSNASRNNLNDVKNGLKGLVNYVTKPFGPFKLAKVLRHCLQRSQADQSGINSIQEQSKDAFRSTGLKTPSAEFEALTLVGDDIHTPIRAQTNGVVTAGETTNALEAVGTLSTSEVREPASNLHSQYPFPIQEIQDSSQVKSIAVSTPNGKTKQPEAAILDDSRQVADDAIPDCSVPALSALGESIDETPNLFKPGTASALGVKEKRYPRVLLVEDNLINMRLLKTFMSKRKYNLVDTAENGQLAVEAAKTQKYDIIFMDISMPVMDGFEATRNIRALEESQHPPSTTEPVAAIPPALIIALTGLASGRDQSEAFRSGVDLFLTKPVSFKEVGRLLDNWETYGEAEKLATKIKSPGDEG